MPINSWGVPISRSQLQQAPAVELTISAGGAITVTGSHHTIDTFGDAGSDNLNTINGLVANKIYRLRAENDARTVVIRHAVDNIICPDAVNVTLAEDQDEVLGFSPDGINLIIDTETTLAGSPTSSDGTNNLSWTVNVDGASAAEDALLVLNSANDAAAARNATFANRGQENAVELSGTAGLDFALVGTGGLQVRNASLDANPQAQLNSSSLSFGAGGGSAVDWVMSRQAADTAELTAGDSLFGLGASILGIKTTTGDAVPSLQLAGQTLSYGPGAAGALDLTLARQAASVAEWGDADSMFIVGAASLGRRASSADAQPTIVLNATGLQLGPGAAGALDLTFARQAANVGEFGNADSIYAVNATLGVRAASADANPTASLNGSQLDLGAGGVTAVDWTLSRQAVDIATMASGDSLYSVAAATIGRRALIADANPTIAMTANGLELGLGGATALDWLLSRQAANVAETGAGDSLFGLGAGIIGIRTSTGDAVPSIQIAGQVLSLGPGAAGALDWTLSRQAVSVAELGDADSLYILGASQLGRRASSADANPTIAFTANGLELGAGGAGALDILISRIGAGALDFATMTAFTASGNTTWDFGTGQADFGGNVDSNAGHDVSGAALTISGFDMACNSQKVAGLGAATVAGDAVRFEQLDTQLNGSVAVADLIQSGQPTATNLLLIGVDTYEADGAGGNINFVIAGSAELTLDNLITEINTNGTELVRADKIGTTVLRLQSAATAGGTAANADPSIVLDASGMANYDFETGDVNMNTLSGRALSLQGSARATLTASAALVGGADAVFFQFTFTPVDFSIQVRDSAGVLKQNVSDQFTIVTNAILWTSAGATHVVNTDTVSIHAWA